MNDKRVANLSDFRWYDGYFSNVRTHNLSPEELNFVRWKIRREVIGMWRATKGDWKYFQGIYLRLGAWLPPYRVAQ